MVSLAIGRGRTEVELDRSLEDAADEASGARAFELFCKPALSSHRSDDHEKLVERARFHLRQAEVRRISTSVGEIETYTFTPEARFKDSVLLLHGWTGEASFMGAFADHLRRRGYRAVLMDMPGHGRSDGQRASLFDCATAVVEVCETISPMRFVVGHSIGAMAALAAAEGHPPLSRRAHFDAYVLISMPNAFADVTREFGIKLGLAPAAQRAFERRLEDLAQRRIQEFTGSGLLRTTGRPTLLLHSRDDQEVPFACSADMAASMPHVALAPFDGLGHRAILYAPTAIRSAFSFFDAQAVQDSA